MTIVTNAPEKIGNYRITGVIGEGANGIVYKAFDPTLQRVVAVKSLHLNLPADARAARAFASRLGEQARSVTRLNHPGIASIHATGESDGRAWIAMEHVTGLDLAQWLSVTPLPPQAALVQVMDQVLEALECAHLSGVRHGDLTLSNVLITQTGQVKLTDFGLARAVGRTGSAPEFQAGRLIDHRVDIYGAGVLLYRMLVGSEPYADALVDTEADALVGTLRAPSTIAEAQRSPEFDDVVARALAHDPNQRYASAADFRDALREAAHVRVPVHGARVVTLAPAASPAASEETEVSTMWGELSRSDRRAAPRTPPSAATVPTLTIAIPDSVLSMPAHDPWAHREPVAPPQRADSELATDLIPNNDERYVAFRSQVERERRASVVSAATAATAALNAAAGSAVAAPAPERNRLEAPEPVTIPTLLSLHASPAPAAPSRGIVVSEPVSQPLSVRDRALPNGAAEFDQADLSLPLAGDGVGIPVEALRRVLRVLSAHFGEMASDVLKHVSARAGTIPELHALLVEQAGGGIDKKKLAKQLRAVAKLPL